MKQVFVAIYLLLSISGCSNTEECDPSVTSSINVDEEVNQIIVIDDNKSEENISSKPIEQEVAKTLKSYYISGVAIDGYVSGATVKVGGKEIITDENGNWFLEYKEDENLSIGEVSISGGTDTATGEAYEGELKVFIEAKDIGTDKNSSVSIPATPLTTLVSAMIINGDSKEKAERQLATALDLSPNIFSQDPVAILKTGTQEEKLESAKAIKKSLVIQKMAESLSQTIMGDSNNSQYKLTAFSSVISAVATKLSDGNSSFDSIMQDTDSIAEVTAQKIEIKMQNNEFDLDINLSETTQKLKAVGEITQSITLMFNSIDVNKLANGGDSHSIDLLLESTAKACEIASLKIEAKVQAIRFLDVSEIDNWVTNTKKVTNSLIMMGGINSLSNKVQNAIVEQNSQTFLNDNDSNISNKINVSDFSEFLSDDLIEEQSNIFDKFADLNISSEMILEAVTIKEQSIKDSNSTETFSLTDAFKEMAKDNDDFEMEEFENHFQDIELDIFEADKNLESALQNNNTIINIPVKDKKDEDKEKEDIEITDEVIIIVRPQPTNPYIPPATDYDNLKFGKIEFGFNKINPTISRNIESGIFETIKFENFGGKPLSEYGTNIDQNLFLTEIELENISFENEKKNISLVFQVQNQETSEKFLAIFPQISLKQENGKFSLKLENLTFRIFTTDINAIETSSEIESAKNYLKIEENEIYISVSKLFPPKFIKNGKFNFQIGLSGALIEVQNGYKFQIENFNSELSGISGNFEILEGILDGNTQAPPSVPNLNFGQ